MIGEDRLLAEITTLALHLGWSFDELLDLEHPLRGRLLDHLNRLLESDGPEA